MRNNRKLAFTLIELLVVVAIIGVLVVIAVPNFLHAQMKAKIAHTQANFYTFSNAFQAFQMDNGSSGK
ncbi:MAG: type II secretion system protein [Candidatus Hinthialibacter antarcticus]|nr:type II secretion system protein [Candidatus Hinthialibacter antarcticus]